MNMGDLRHEYNRGLHFETVLFLFKFFGVGGGGGDLIYSFASPLYEVKALVSSSRTRA